MMQIIPIAFDSMGTRSMATYVETDDIKIMIDPAVALGAKRYGLPPHPVELQRKDEHWMEIKKYTAQADILIVTHYHYDHHNPSEPQVYKDKILFTKHPDENINKSQKDRAKYFLNVIEKLPADMEYSDGKEFKFGDTTVIFSPAVPHGNNDRLGYVTEVCIDAGDYKLLHTSDIEGGNLDCQCEFIINQDPNIVIFDGPMTYPFENIIPNLIKILEQTKVEKLIIDHHYLRNINWKEKLSPVYDTAVSLNKRLCCVAEFLGKKEELLEANRKVLYEQGYNNQGR
jgi:hypothetical protein